VYLRIARTQDLFPDVRNDPPGMVTTLLERKKALRIGRTQDLFPDVRNVPPGMVSTLLERKKKHYG
jgi:hypothetical protein